MEPSPVSAFAQPFAPHDERLGADHSEASPLAQYEHLPHHPVYG